MKTILVTGGAGFIGHHMIRRLLKHPEYNIISLDRLDFSGNLNRLSELGQEFPTETIKRLRVIHHDLRAEINPQLVKQIGNVDVIIHMAAGSHVNRSIENPMMFVMDNVVGTCNILEFARRTDNLERFVYFSTDEVYGDIEEGSHVETDLLKPSNPYSATKAAADMLIMAWGRTHNVPYMIIRPTNNYGIGQYVEKLIPKSVKYLKLGRKIPLHNNGMPYRNWLHADDTAEAVITLIEKGQVGEIYNIAGGFEQQNIETVRQVISKFVEVENWYDFNDDNNFIDFSYSRPGQDVRYALDDSKLKSLGWSPKKTFSHEISNIVNYYKNKFIW